MINVIWTETQKTIMMETNNSNIDNEIDWKIIDQLHNATNNFSKTSLELKKLLFVVIGITAPIIIHLSDNKLDKSLFCILYILVVLFWIFDSYTYYYQESLRGKMDEYFANLSKRNNSTENRNYTLSDSRKKCRKLRSLFNLSFLLFYGILILLITLGLILHCLGKI